MSMNKEEFVNGFFDFEFDPDEIPSDWMSAAWENEEIREYLTYDMTRMISKNGELYYKPPFAALLVRSLNCEQVVRLYEEIRADADRDEEEWREGFAALFHHCAQELPPPRVDPYHDWHLQAREFPREWMEDAWANPQIRENMIRGMARHLDRGNDAWCAPDWLDLLDRSLNREQIVALYREFREYASRPESEWRGVFEEAFPDCAEHFPAPLEGS